MNFNVSSKILNVPEEHIGQRLDNFLIRRLKGLPKSCLYRLLRQKKIRVNKKRGQPDYRLQAQDIISIPNLHLKSPSLTPLTPSYSLKTHLINSILFEDNQLCVINKPTGLAVHGGSGVQLGLIEAFRQIKSELKFLELAHRLDRETSGCLLLAKKSACLKQLHTLFREGDIEKTYFALVEGHWPPHLQEISVALKKNQLRSGERMVCIDESGKAAHTRFRVLKVFTHTGLRLNKDEVRSQGGSWSEKRSVLEVREDRSPGSNAEFGPEPTISRKFSHSSLLEIQLYTGRTHQIRVHAQHGQHPIAGDEKYGNNSFNQQMRALGLKRLFLHAAQLRFRLPTSKHIFDIKAPLPADLEAVLQKLALLEKAHKRVG